MGEFGNAFFGDFGFNEGSSVNAMSDDFFDSLSTLVEVMVELVAKTPKKIIMNPYLNKALADEIDLKEISFITCKTTGMSFEVESDFNEPFFRFE